MRFAGILKITACRRPSLRLLLHASASPVFIPSYDEATLDSIVAKCSSLSEIKSFHAQIILRGLGGDTISISKLISLCALSSFGDQGYADYLFEGIPSPNRYVYNTLIRASINKGNAGKAMFLYRKMVNSGIFPNEFTFPFILKACAFMRAYLEGISVHLHAVKLGFSECCICVQNGLINFYIGCGKIESAREIFSLMDCKTVISWNSMIRGYAKIGLFGEAFLLFVNMRNAGLEPDGHTFVSLLSVCSKINSVDLGKSLHCCCEVNGIAPDVYFQNALLNMYAKCGHLHMSEAIFARMANKGVVSWTSMLSAYAKHGLVELAETTFNQTPLKNVVSWNAMITCYLQNGHFKKCLQLFDRMLASSLAPNHTTISSALSACSQLGDFVAGKKLHEYLCTRGLPPATTTCNALIFMYAKCGYLEAAMDAFLSMPDKNVVSRNTMINALAFHGSGRRAVELLEKMEASGVQPDAVTFSGLLSACCHSGLNDTGKLLFHKMKHDYSIPYEIQHYACMVDILGRGGLFREALSLIGGMPMKPDTVIWGALLGACRIHLKVPIAKLVLKQLLEMEAYSGGVYVLVSNIFCESQKLDEMKKMWVLINGCCVQKSKGISSVEVSGRVHDFMVGDK